MYVCTYSCLLMYVYQNMYQLCMFVYVLINHMCSMDVCQYSFVMYICNVIINCGVVAGSIVYVLFSLSFFSSVIKASAY